MPGLLGLAAASYDSNTTLGSMTLTLVGVAGICIALFYPGEDRSIGERGVWGLGGLVVAGSGLLLFFH